MSDKNNSKNKRPTSNKSSWAGIDDGHNYPEPASTSYFKRLYEERLDSTGWFRQLLPASAAPSNLTPPDLTTNTAGHSSTHHQQRSDHRQRISEPEPSKTSSAGPNKKRGCGNFEMVSNSIRSSSASIDISASHTTKLTSSTETPPSTFRPPSAPPPLPPPPLPPPPLPPPPPPSMSLSSTSAKSSSSSNKNWKIKKMPSISIPSTVEESDDAEEQYYISVLREAFDKTMRIASRKLFRRSHHYKCVCTMKRDIHDFVTSIKEKSAAGEETNKREENGRKNIHLTKRNSEEK